MKIEAKKSNLLELVAVFFKIDWRPEFTGFTGSTEGKPVLTYSVYQHYLTERNLEVDAFLYQITNTMLYVTMNYLLMSGS